MNKPFDEELFKEYDLKGRIAIRDYMAKQLIIDNPDIYGPDLILGNSKKCYLEVQINQRWVGGPFPYDTVTIPQRKKKYMQAGKVYYFVISANIRMAVMIDDVHIQEKYLKEHKNKYMAESEYFYFIPLALCKQIVL